MEGASPFMASRRTVLLTPPKSSGPTQLLFRQQSAPISPLAATLMNLPASVANKGFTPSLSLLAATLTKNRGWGPPPCASKKDVHPESANRGGAEGFFSGLTLLYSGAPRVLHNSFTTKRFRTLSQNCRVYINNSHSGTRFRPSRFLCDLSISVSNPILSPLTFNFQLLTSFPSRDLPFQPRVGILLSPQGSTSSRSTVHSFYLPLLQDGDDFDFDERVLRKPRDLHGRSRRRCRREVARIHFVHRPEIVHVLQENRRLNHVSHLRAGRLHDAPHVLQNPLRLLADVGLRHLAGFWIQRHLTRDEQKAIRPDGLRVRSDGFRAPVGQYDISHGAVSLEVWVVPAVSPYRARNSSGTPGRLIHRRTNSATFSCVSCSKAAIRSLNSSPRSLRAYSMLRTALRNTSRPYRVW